MIIYIYMPCVYIYIYVYIHVYIHVCMLSESDMQHRWYYYTSPQQYSHCWSSISFWEQWSSIVLGFQQGGEGFEYILVVLYQCFILVEENCFDSTMVKWV